MVICRVPDIIKISQRVLKLLGVQAFVYKWTDGWIDARLIDCRSLDKNRNILFGIFNLLPWSCPRDGTGTKTCYDMGVWVLKKAASLKLCSRSFSAQSGA